MKKLETYSAALLRIGMALVFLWFGTSQMIDAVAWTAFVPDWVMSFSHLSVTTVVHLNGAFEVVFGSMLLLGFFTRLAALLLALHMIDITLTVGFDSIGVRDFGLSVATIVIWLNGHDRFTLDRYISGGDIGK